MNCPLGWWQGDGKDGPGAQVNRTKAVPTEHDSDLQNSSGRGLMMSNVLALLHMNMWKTLNI